MYLFFKSLSLKNVFWGSHIDQKCQWMDVFCQLLVGACCRWNIYRKEIGNLQWGGPKNWSCRDLCTPKLVANGAAISDLSEFYLDPVRPGTMIYGLCPSSHVRRWAFWMRRIDCPSGGSWMPVGLWHGRGLTGGPTMICLLRPADLRCMLV